MARRRDWQKPDVLSTEEISELRRQLAHLSVEAVRNAYHMAHTRCHMVNDRVPSPRAVHELIQAWKQLWKWRG